MKQLLLNLLMPMLTEEFAKKLIIKVLTWLVNETETEKDNEILNMIKEVWEVK